MSPASSVIPVQRRLAAVLAADIAGYSRLMAEDEAATVRDLKAHQGVVLPMIAAAGGRIIDLAGDGILAEFASIVTAVQCAVEIQHRMAARNADVPPERRMRYRIGVNLGDVLFDDHRLYGDGVNVAARLEGRAPPGGLLISGKAHAEVADKVGIRFDDLGEQQLKNIVRPIRVFRACLGGDLGAAEPAAPAPVPASPRRRRRWRGVAALAVTALVLAGGWHSRILSLFGRDAPVVAVMPFRSLSGDGQPDYFSEGITQDIATALGRFTQIPVIAPDALAPLARAGATPDMVRRKVGARYLVEGSVRRAGDEVRVSVDLVDTERGLQLWADSYDRELADIFAVQDEIARQVASMTVGRVVAAEQMRRGARTPARLQAYDAALRGRAALARKSPDDNRAALAAFTEAQAKDPAFAPAYAGAALALLDQAAYRWTDDPDTAVGRAGDLAAKALELDARELAAHRALAQVATWRRDYATALAEADNVVQLDPSEPGGYVARAIALAWQGAEPDLAVAAFEAAMRLRPTLAPETAAVAGLAYYLAGRDADALAQLHRSLDEMPAEPLAHLVLAAALAHAGRGAEAAGEAAWLRAQASRAPEAVVDRIADPVRRDAVLRDLRRAGVLRSGT